MTSPRHLGTGCEHCLPHFHTEHLLCVTHHMVFSLRNGGGNDGASAGGWISGGELSYLGTLFSSLSTWLCILAPKQVAKHSQGQPPARSLHGPREPPPVLPTQEARDLGSLRSLLAGRQVVGFVCSIAPKHRVRNDGCLGERLLCPLCKSDLDMGVGCSAGRVHCVWT